MKITVHNPNGLPTIDYRTVQPLQGDLKDLSEKNYNKLKNVLVKRGFTAPLFIWLEQKNVKGRIVKNYWLLDGHGRQRVMSKEDMQPYEVPYLLIEAKDIQDAKTQLLEITSQYQTITQEGFDEFTADLLEADLIDVHFDALFEDREEEAEVEEDEAPEVSSEPCISKFGEVYKMGKHRIYCGNANNLAKLLDDKTADMIFTDPPYNVDYTGKTKDSLKIENDSFKDNEEYYDFLIDTFGHMATKIKDGATIYVCHPDYRGEWVRRAFREAGFYLSQCIIWNKNSLVIGRQDYHWKHEPILYGWKEGASHKFYGPRNEVSVWDIDKPTRNSEHPTMKPIALIAKALENSSKEGDIILDSFSGSGSGLIACEQLNRIFYGAEIDPRYCDVIRKRYCKFVNNNELPDNWAELTPAV